ncbi:MAG: hypothetical protein LBJ46_05395 [Planctomycetota bacterium]|jgi:hypothetical protein|nr:hypothetical protein [Planctomycetota bacterium]
MCKRTVRLAGLLAVVLTAAGGARALDVGEIKDMLRANVPENVIINLAESQGGFYLTEAEMDDLRSFGASEDLVAELSFVPVPDDGPAASTVAPPTIVGPRPATAYAEPPAAAPPPTYYGADPPGTAVSPLAVASPVSLPPLYDKEGWLSISNRDYQTYYLQINAKDHRMFLSRHPNGGVELEPGGNVVLNVRKEGYKLYGDNGKKLEVKIREGETTTLSLDPFGVVGDSGLNVVAVNRDKVRSEALFDSHAPAPVVVAPAPRVIYQPAPPPVVIHEPRPGFNFGFHYGGGPRGGRHRRGWR